MIIGGIEAGGTKMVCAIGNEFGDITKRITFPTETPDITIQKMINFFKGEPIDALGIGCFGPIDLNQSSTNYGTIGNTPKQAWRNYNIFKAFRDAFNVPIGMDTDVNAAALGEATWGAGKKNDVVLYITIGTGVGVGVCIGGKPLHGLLHPEAGHILIRRHINDTFEGNCSYHKDCLEGLAAGPAIEKRWGKKGLELAGQEQVWEMEAFYIAQAIANYILTLSPNKIILWGGVMHQEQLFPLVRKGVKEFLNGYLHVTDIQDIDQYIVMPGLGDNAGCKGALCLGKQAIYY